MNLKPFVMMVLVVSVIGCYQKEKNVKVYDIPKLKPQQPLGSAMMSGDESSGSGESMVASAGSGGNLKWVTPKSWKEVKSQSAMRLVSFNTQESGGADVSIVSLGAMAGGEESNVNRWRDQVGLGPLSGEEISNSAMSGQSPVGPYRWFRIYGASSAIFVAIIKPGGQTIFVKMMGEAEELRNNEKPFLELVRSLNYK
ncbi:MAG: hypothetical protein KDD61_14945 [Bdellovibrionales bacterium]|nr:hypothetical protein [Bdellovibrionales bacterium]